MKITFEIEKILKYDKVEVELTPEQVETIQKEADRSGISFEDAFHFYADMKGILFDIMWDKDEEDTEYEVWDVEIVKE